MRYYLKIIKQTVIVTTCLLVVVGCTFSDAFLESVRPVYRAQGGASEMGQQSNYSLGKQYFLDGRYGLALEAFQAELAQNKRSVSALNGIAACYDKLKRYDLALSYYYKALQIQSDSVRTLSNLGYSFILQGRFQEADKVLRLALHYNPENVRVKQHLANLAEKSPSMADSDTVDIQLEQQTVAKTLTPGKADMVVTENLSAPVVQAVKPEQDVAVSTVAQALEADEGRDAAQHRTDDVQVAVSPVMDTPAQMPEEIVASDETVNQPVAEIQPVKLVMDEIAVHAVNTPVRGKGGKIEVSNGNGSPGNAHLLAIYLTNHGERVWRITNAENFNHQNTVIFYQSGKRLAAERLANKLPVEAELIESTENYPGIAVRLVLGQELVFYKSSFRRKVEAQQIDELFAQNFTFGSESAVQFTIEVSNGNGSNGMARLLSDILAKHGQTIKRVTNASTYDYEKTVIYYQPGKLDEALQIASELPVEARLKKADIKHRNVKMRIIMGRDFLNYKAAMELLVDKSA
jgi:tetratricopeptide (TPR) repeat protein